MKTISISLLLLVSCSKVKQCKQHHESLNWNSATNQFKYEFMHETAFNEVKKPHVDWQYYGEKQSGTSMNKFRFKHICDN